MTGSGRLGFAAAPSAARCSLGPCGTACGTAPHADAGRAISSVYGDLPLIDGAVYVDKEHLSFTWRYVGELPDEHVPEYCRQVFRSCRSGKLTAMPYTEAEKRLRLHG